MGSWGTSAERRGDRMPRMQAQAVEERAQQESVLRNNDLGSVRINELPLDDTHSRGHIPLRPRPPPEFVESSASLEGYRAMARSGLEDSEALAVKELSDLGGADRYRLSAGPAREYTPSRRPTEAAVRAAQVTRHGVVLPPGPSVVHRSSTTNGMSVTSRAAASAPAVPAPSARQVNTASNATTALVSQTSERPLPPHLRTVAPEPRAGTDTSPKLSSTVSQSAPTSNAQTSANVTVASTKPTSSSNQTAPGGKAVPDSPGCSGSCLTAVEGLGRQPLWFDYKLEVDNDTGEAYFILSRGDLEIDRRSLRGHEVRLQMQDYCIVCFTLPQKVVYNLKFKGPEKMQAFISAVGNIKTGMDFAQKRKAALEKLSASSPRTEAETQATVGSQPSTESHPRSAVAATAQSSVAPATKTSSKAPAPTAATQPSATSDADVKQKLSNDSKPKINGVDDDFGKLSLSNVKGSAMYKYTPEKLMERRPAAEVPPGIKDVKIPVQKAPSTRFPVHQRGGHSQDSARPKAPAAKDSTAFMKDWLKGKETSTASKVESSASMQAPETQASQESHAASQATVTDVPVKTETSPVPDQSPIVDESLLSRPDGSEVATLVNDKATSNVDAGVSAVTEDTDLVDTTEEKKPVETHVSDMRSETVVEPAGTSTEQKTTKTGPASECIAPSEQPTPVLAPTVLPSPDKQQANSHTVQGMPPQIEAPQMMPFQAYYGQLQGQQMFPNLPNVPAGQFVAAISVTYHLVTEPPRSRDDEVQASQSQAPTGHAHNSSGSTLSAGVAPFHPRRDASRNGLGNSRHATGYTEAKFAGNFTGVNP
ncbi:hypothetical protein CTRI78_v006683 [Colletotrichum trifolii]|uniref:Uncharacterized protein n=1 Tax=Colletotrichum trifolii TaxID=5466 RepID=A0A4R8RF06_COLTR|nr:hypothetical protein CTRI78_v006683 [Colletotrichum trifolii]